MRKDVFFYFRKSVAFFDLKAKSIPPIVFIVILALYSLNFYINQIGYGDYGITDALYYSADSATAPVELSFTAMVAGIVIMLLINIVSFIYLDAVIREAKHEDYTSADCIKSALRRFPHLTGVTIIKNMILAAGLFLFIIPGIYMAILLIFAECAVLDKNNRTIASLKFSGALTNRRRGDIFKIELFCNLIIAFIVILLLFIFSSNNAIVFQYILLFMLSLCTLVEHKLVAHLYVDALAAREGRIAGADPESDPDSNQYPKQDSASVTNRAPDPDLIRGPDSDPNPDPDADPKPDSHPDPASDTDAAGGKTNGGDDAKT